MFKQRCQHEPLLRSPCFPLSAADQVVETEIENRAQTNDNIVLIESPQVTDKGIPSKTEGVACDVGAKEGSGYRRSSSVNMKKMKQIFQNATEENVRSIRAYVTVEERVAKLQYQKQLLVCQVLELEANEAEGYNIEDEEDCEANEPQVSWNIAFKEQRQQIIKLWDVCYVSIIHRTQFYLLFKGDPADQIYFEVELRRLTWLQQHLAETGNDASPAPGGDETTISVSSRWSLRAITFEMLVGYPPFYSDDPMTTWRKVHPWFNGIDWERIYQMEAAFIPEVTDVLDTQNFENFDETRSSKDLNLVGYTYKNFDIVNDYQLPGIGCLIVMLVCGSDLLESFQKSFWIPEQVGAIVRDFGVACIRREGQDVEKIVSYDPILPENKNQE